MRIVYRAGLFIPAITILAVLLGACGAFSGGSDVNDLETRNAQLQGTIDGLGTPASTIAALKMTAERGIVLELESGRNLATAVAAQSTLAALQSGGSGVFSAPAPTAAAPSLPEGQQPPATSQTDPASIAGGGEPQATAAAINSSTNFSQTTTATGRDNQDCPLGATSSFDVTQDIIYVITRVSLLEGGSTLSARWYNSGTLYFDDSECWVPDQDYQDICAYCSLGSDGEPFPTGNWMVELLLNGQLMSQAQFQITDSTQQDDTGDEMSDTTN